MKYCVTFGNSLYPDNIVFAVVADIEQRFHLGRVLLEPHKWVFEGPVSDAKSSIQLLPGPVDINLIPAEIKPRLTGYRVTFDHADKLAKFLELVNGRCIRNQTSDTQCVIKSNIGPNYGLWKMATSAALRVCQNYKIERVTE